MASRGKVCLAYSGGLDTSCILKWLLEQKYSVVCFLGNVGQEEDFDKVQAKALKIGASKMVILDLREELIDLAYRAVQCNAQYENVYMLGTSLARPVIARAQMQVALQEGCEYISHGCTAKGNDQIRFELAFLTIDPQTKILAPWKIPAFYERFQGRRDLVNYATQSGIPVASAKAPYSMDDNIIHCSYESGELEDPSKAPQEEMWTRTNDPLKAPSTPQEITISFEKGIPTKLSSNGKTWTGKLELFTAVNEIGKLHGIGRVDIVESRYIGLKSRGCYDTPGLTILRAAHVDLEGLVLDRNVRKLRDQWITPVWSELIYNGLYFSPEREFLEPSLTFSQQRVNGQVHLRLYKGNVWIIGRSSETDSLYDEELSSMDTLVGFNGGDVTGFINVNALRLKKYGQQKKEQGQSLAKP